MARLYFFIFLLYSCTLTSQKNEQKETSGDTKNTKEVVDSLNITQSYMAQNIEKKWLQYKKLPALNQSDTLPYENCYITINGSVFSYYRLDKLIENRTLIRDSNFKYEVYGFKEKPGDYLQFLDTTGNRVVLKRHYYDGEQEYFIKVKF